jgi:hypothetical protein
LSVIIGLIGCKISKKSKNKQEKCQKNDIGREILLKSLIDDSDDEERHPYGHDKNNTLSLLS